ncbi:nonstructural protein NS4 [Betacoronavirus sp.]|nr:nonstructural protein NS4 [Betacoronavirus sp.]AYR18626.1 nonstructural protein NS4 [Betacoronavirus sp.]AYR18635.1 nonstructural protein NS4 [Betacoronavirus sp.]AYR18644.1 nonstructural protein NS4 [Betacoronavirus sp.]AYR18671.1 nonstructural protein NS4 [Betacoronavirus sp.]
MKSDSVKIIAILVLTPILVALVVGVLLLYSSFVISGLDIRNTTNPSVRIGTVSYTINTPPAPMVIYGEDGRVTLIKPTDTYTSVYLGKFRGFDTSITEFKTPEYSTSIKPIFTLGKPYNFRHLPKFRRPTLTWIPGL